MFNLDKFIAESVTFRPVSMFAESLEANKEKLTEVIKGIIDQLPVEPLSLDLTFVIQS